MNLTEQAISIMVCIFFTSSLHSRLSLVMQMRKLTDDTDLKPFFASNSR